MVPLASYCERDTAGFWAEPLNAWSNVAFIVCAGWIALRVLRRHDNAGRGWDLWLLALLAAAVGVGSFLWHTLRAPWTQWADIIPILLFINLFLASFLVRVAAAGVAAVVVLVIGYNAVNVGLQAALPSGLLNGSVFYLPTWLTLLALCAYSWRRQPGAARALLGAALAFTLALSLRTLDQAWCPAMPYGTHFGWHVLNALVLALVTSVLWRQPSAADARAHP